MSKLSPSSKTVLWICLVWIITGLILMFLFSCEKAVENDIPGPSINVEGIQSEYSLGDTMILKTSGSTFSPDYPYDYTMVKKLSQPQDSVISYENEVSYTFTQPGTHKFYICVVEKYRGWSDGLFVYINIKP